MQSLTDNIIQSVGSIVLGKEHQVKLSLACLLAKGHLLLEDLPGMGKTTLAQCLARALGLNYQRVQFTSDLLPADILGVAIFDKTTSVFRFHAGPVFSQVLLADEINRSTPKTQSALLEAMEEGQVSVEGETRPLPAPFFVIATQNPQSQAGTYPLPESQLDRFLMRISMGYPSYGAEQKLLLGKDSRADLAQLKPAVSSDQLLQLQQQVSAVKVTKPLVEYLQRLINFSREDEVYTLGLSPRGGLAWLQAAKAWAMLHNRDYVIPEDIQAVALPVAAHRLAGHFRDSKLASTQVHPSQSRKLGSDASTSIQSASHGQSLVSHLLNSVDVVSL